MKKISLFSIALTFFITSVLANEVNIFSARHYDSDVQLYEKFTAKTGIKVNVVSGKSGALEKRIMEEGSESKADLYITADAGRLGAFQAKGMFQRGASSAAIKKAVPANFRTAYWTGIAKRARIVYFAPERVSGADLVFFDGTLWVDDEMIREKVGIKTGQRMGHISVSGQNGALSSFADLDVKRKVFIHINTTNPILADDSAERAAVLSAGWEVSHDGMAIEL